MVTEMSLFCQLKLIQNSTKPSPIIQVCLQLNASKKWTMPIRNWKPALNSFMIEFEERLVDS